MVLIDASNRSARAEAEIVWPARRYNRMPNMRSIRFMTSPDLVAKDDNQLAAMLRDNIAHKCVKPGARQARVLPPRHPPTRLDKGVTHDDCAIVAWLD